MAGSSAQEVIHFHVKNGQIDDAEDSSHGWRSTPQLPTGAELMATETPELPPNNANPPASKERYLDTQYRLYRCEGTELLRQAISDFRQNPGGMESSKYRIYTQVHVCGLHCSKLGAASRISFSTERSPLKVNWGQSERLTPGTLVALSPSSDSFKTRCIPAIIAARPLIGGLEPDVEAGEDKYTPPRVDVFWDNENAIDPTIELVMVEASGGYFETVRYPMLGLQHAALESSRFDKYLIDACVDIEPAAYLNDLPGQSAVKPEAAKLFDSSQEQAFYRMTSEELAITQGPPGTGKTFASVVTIESIVKTLQRCRHSTSPIIISAQTNHALDQLLQLCIQGEVGEVLRLGSRSSIEMIKQRTLYHLRQRSKFKKFDRGADSVINGLFSQLQKHIQACFPGGLVTAETFLDEGIIRRSQFDSLAEDEWETASTTSDQEGVDGLIASWLDDCIEKDREYVYTPPEDQRDPDAEEEEKPQGRIFDIEDEDKDHLQGDFVSMKLNWTGAIPIDQEGGTWWSRAEELAKTPDLYQIKPVHRGMVYRYWRRKLLDKLGPRVARLLQEYQQACERRKISRWTNDVTVIHREGIQIIGCTTTGLTKNRGLLAAVRPRVLLIEEAAETREANIASALLPSIEQLILVGDHQQLPPHSDVRHLGGHPYYLDTSLFERLVKLNIPYTTLEVQRRMIPTISEVVRTFYPMLRDHESVKNTKHRPPVVGMGGTNMWWFQHHWPEGRSQSSYLNNQEAIMAVSFMKYLVQHGVRPGQITILTYYNGQVKLIQRLLNSGGSVYQDCAVRTVDGFQGEENDVILLSLVRSPGPLGRAKAGFVQDQNRAVVATSRARCGFYVFGDARNLLCSSTERNDTWQRIFGVFDRQHHTEFGLPIACEGVSKGTQLRDPRDWSQILNNRPCQPCNVDATSMAGDVQTTRRGGSTRGGRPGRGPRGRGNNQGRERYTKVYSDTSMDLPVQETSGKDKHLTSDELMASGYFSQYQQHETETLEESGPSQYWVDGGADLIDTRLEHEARSEQPSLASPHISPSLRPTCSPMSSRRSTAMSSPLKGDSIWSRWTAETLEENAAALQQALAFDAEQTRQARPNCSTTIRETYLPTTTDGAGTRLYPNITPIETQHINVAASDVSLAGLASAASGSGDGGLQSRGEAPGLVHREPSRTSQLLDDVAGVGSPCATHQSTELSGQQEEDDVVEAVTGPMMGVLIDFS